MKHNAFSLIELLVVVAIIAVLAAIALPLYNQYKYRAVAAQGVLILNDFLEKITLYHDRTGNWPTTFVYAGQTFTANTNTYLSGGTGGVGGSIALASPVENLRYGIGNVGANTNMAWASVTLSGLTGYTANLGGTSYTYQDYGLANGTLLSPNLDSIHGGVAYLNGAYKYYCGTYAPGATTDIQPGILPSSCTCVNMGNNLYFSSASTVPTPC